MRIGVIAGIGVAVAGGVAAFSFVGEPRTGQLNAAELQRGEQECWDEQVATVADPRDEHRIAGTAIGAVVGGASGFWESKVLLTAVEFDLFTVLGEGAMTATQLGEKLGIHARGRFDFFDALVAAAFFGARRRRP